MNADSNGSEHIYKQSIKNLKAGKYREGWMQYESRFKLHKLAPDWLLKDWPKWDGQHKGNVLVWTEQGLGDALFFSRWLKPLVKKVGKVDIFDRMCMLRLWDLSSCVNKVIDRGYHDELKGYDYQTSMMSLPHLLELPVVAEHDGAFDGIGDKLPTIIKSSSIKKVGICWSGNPGNPADSRRSSDLSDMRPIIERNDIACVSLQMSTWFPYKTREVEKGLLRRLITVSESLTDDVYDMASIIKQLDVVVTVDTMVAHLAGLLNIPVYVMLDSECDWRWGHGKDYNKRGDKTIWYNSMNLFRRGEGECWKRTIAEINSLL